MTPQDKAKELVNKMYYQSTSKFDAKQCALIAVELVLSTNTDESFYGSEFSKYWNKVKQEIEKL
jgi:hypothetical protein